MQTQRPSAAIIKEMGESSLYPVLKFPLSPDGRTKTSICCNLFSMNNSGQCGRNRLTRLLLVWCALIASGFFAPTHARMLVFALSGKAVLPEPEPYTPPPLNPPPSTAAAEVIAHGGQLYTQYCSVCHGANGFQGRSSFPNLTITPLLWTQPGFDQVVLGGGRADKGMGSFAKDLKPEDAAAVREYLISRANAIKTNGPPAGFGAPR